MGGLSAGYPIEDEIRFADDRMPPFHVLIVDDQRDARLVLRAGLETLGSQLKVTDVPSGEEAILVIASQPIDLLVADIRLPGISGLELQQRARQRNPGLKVILVTGVTDARIRDKVARAGAEAFFFKPVEMAGFLEAVQRSLGSVEESRPVMGVAERLDGLCQDTQAMCAVLINQDGDIVAQAGNLPPDIDEANLVQALLITLDVTNKFSLAVGAVQPADFMLFSGGAYELALAHVGQTMGLLLLAAPGWTDEKQVHNLKDTLQLAVKDLLVSLPVRGLPLAVPDRAPLIAPAPPVEPEPENNAALPDLEQLFHQAAQAEKTQADAFWEAAVVEDRAGEAGADTLSYEQAQKLGLAPPEDK